MSAVIDRFLKYVSFDTQSEGDHEEVPSTEKQWELARYLAEEMKAMGLADVELRDHAYVFGTLPANTDEDLPVLGLIAHMDTSDAISGKDVKPRMVSYQGGDIVLNEEKDIVMRAAEFPRLQNYVGKTLIVTDGTTLLGADDKAGVAEIMSACAYLLEHPEIKHGPVRIGFTPDEEVGNGPKYFDVDAFGADYAYTVDGGAIGEIEYENFNAAGAAVTVHGTSIHPGAAKWKMKDGIRIAMEFENLLPVYQDPYCTDGYEGFFHIVGIKGSTEQVEMAYIIRDHDMQKFEEKKALFAEAAAFLNKKYGAGTVEVRMRDSYYNMKEMIEPNMHLIENAKAAMEELGIQPVISPIRGGTDGAQLSFMGLPCPNLCTGGENCHGKFEFACVEDMEKITGLLTAIICRYAA